MAIHCQTFRACVANPSASIYSPTQSQHRCNKLAKAAARPITESQREFLESQLRPSPNRLDGKILAFLILGAFYGIFFLLPAVLLSTFVVGPVAWLASFFGLVDTSVGDNFGAIVAIVYVVTCICAIYVATAAGRHQRKVNLELLPKIHADLALGEVLEERFQVAGVKLFQESEHKAFLLFIHLSNGRTLVLYDHLSFDGQGNRSWDDPPMMEVREALCRITFPNSKFQSWDFSGEIVPLPTKLEMTNDPKKWPEDESWCRVKWENIERHYGAKKKPRQAAASRRS